MYFAMAQTFYQVKSVSSMLKTSNDKFNDVPPQYFDLTETGSFILDALIVRRKNTPLEN